MTRKKVKRSTRRRLSIFGTLSIIIIGYFLFTLFQQGYNLYKLTGERIKLEEKYKNLKNEAEELEIEIKQLNDPEYLAKYARENYSYSKEGEYIIKLKETEEEIEDVDHTIKKEYIIIGLSLFLVFIFIYIITRGHKKNK